MWFRGLLSGFALATLLAALPATRAGAAQWWEKNFWMSGPSYNGVLPACDNQDALGRITSRFGEKESTYWASNLKIAAYEQIHEIAYRPWAVDAIPRRFCQGIADMSDGSRHGLVYSIGEDTGMIGASWGIEWCVVGLDRDWAYNPACKMAQP